MLTIVNIRCMLPMVNTKLRLLELNTPMRFLTPKDLGALVRDARLNQGITQAQLGAKIGASRYWVAEFERGKSGAELGLTLKALRALKLVLTVETKDDALRRENADPTARQATSAGPSQPAVDLSSILKRSTTPTPWSQQRAPFQTYGWNVSSESEERAGEPPSRGSRKRSRGE